MEHIFAGFGFGPIQSGLFAPEAWKSGSFSSIAVAEVDDEIVQAVRSNNDSYSVNIAHKDGLEILDVEGIKLYNTRSEIDRNAMLEQLANATEIVTSLPSVDFFEMGGSGSVAGLIGHGLQGYGAGATVVYTAENNNHAAEMLSRKVSDVVTPEGFSRPCQFLNTVIGKMSQVVTEPEEIDRLGLKPMTPGFPRAFLVEEFNHILVSRITVPGFEPALTAFEEKDNLYPFEEAKLYGHNAIQTMLGFFGHFKGCNAMSELKSFPDIMETGKQAFKETGRALIKCYGDSGEYLFTETGFTDYAEDLLERITNPYLHDSVARAVRDPLRKLSYDDRIFGAIRRCLEQQVSPRYLARGACAGLSYLYRCDDVTDLPVRELDIRRDNSNRRKFIRELIAWLWKDDKYSLEELDDISTLLAEEIWF